MQLLSESRHTAALEAQGAGVGAVRVFVGRQGREAVGAQEEVQAAPRPPLVLWGLQVCLQAPEGLVLPAAVLGGHCMQRHCRLGSWMSHLAHAQTSLKGTRRRRLQVCLEAPEGLVLPAAVLTRHCMQYAQGGVQPEAGWVGAGMV